MNSTNIISDNNGTLSRNVLHGAFSIVVTTKTNENYNCGERSVSFLYINLIWNNKILLVA
jgi:hypothetical protein